MADKTIWDLDASGALADTDRVPVQQAGTAGTRAKHFLLSALKTFIGAIVGSTGAVDDALLAADGTGGKTAQPKSVTLSDTTGVFTQTTANTGFTFTANGSGNHLFSNGLIQLGGATSSFPALKRDGANLGLRAADDSKYQIFRAEGFEAKTDAGGARLITLYAGGGGFDELALASGLQLKWGSTATDTGSADLGLARDSAGVLRVSNASTGIGATLTSRVIEANTAGSGAPNVLAATESRKLLTNEGSTAENYETLPSCAAGIEFWADAIDSDGMRITAGAGDEIEVAGTVSALAGFIRLASNAKVCLVGLNATRWCAMFTAGTVTVDA